MAKKRSSTLDGRQSNLPGNDGDEDLLVKKYQLQSLCCDKRLLFYFVDIEEGVPLRG